MKPVGSDTDTRDVPVLMAGARVAGRFVVEEEIGRGGMGAVYRVYDRLLEQQIALKVPIELVKLSTDDKESLRREVVLARRVTHPSVARVYDMGEHQGLLFLTMELVEGRPLSHRAGNELLPVDAVVQIGQQVSCALNAAHSAGVLHLDLKPGNLLYAEGSGPRVKIVDFGIARVLGSRSSGSGTLDYMAPEQLLDEPLTGAADVYALGLVLHRLLCGRRAFEGESAAARARARLTNDAVPLPSRAPKPLADLVWRMLARQPASRPSMSQVAERLSQLATASAQRGDDGAASLRGVRGSAVPPDKVTALLLARRDVLSPGLTGQHLELFAEVEQLAPGLPLVAALRAVTLVRRWTASWGGEVDIPDGAVRATNDAIAAAGQFPEAHLADSLVAHAYGDVRGMLRALARALARDPSHEPCRAILAQLELEAGLPSSLNLGFLKRTGRVPAWVAVLEARELLFDGRYEQARRAIDALEASPGGDVAAMTLRVRACLYRDDAGGAAALLPKLAVLTRHEPFARVLQHLLEQVARRRAGSDADDAFLQRLLSSPASPRRHTFYYQLVIELVARTEPEHALVLLWRAAHLPLTDLRWLDHCPALDVLREYPSFKSCRRAVRARLEPLLEEQLPFAMPALLPRADPGPPPSLGAPTIVPGR